MALHIPATRPSLDKIMCSNDALGCGRPVLAKGLCARCYQRRANGVPMDSLDRHPRGTAFDDRYEAAPSGCYEWTAGRFSSGGYGEFYVKGQGMVRAHRYAWEREHGPVPEGMFVCHRCDNPPCVRVDHLFLGSPAANAADMASKDRRKGKGSMLSPDDVLAIRSDPRYQREIAAEYGITQTAVSMIKLRKNWKHL